MKVLFASHHCCIRVVKEGLALIKQGVDVLFLQERIANTDFTNALPACSFYCGQEEYRKKLAYLLENNDIPIVHVHNEPDWIVHVAKEVAGPDVAVIYDVHDLQSVRHNEVHGDEALAIEACDGLVFTSAQYQQMTHDWYNLYKPSIVLQSRCIEDMIVEKPLPMIGGICYEGGIQGKVEHAVLDYQNYLPLAEVLYKADIPAFFYGAAGSVMAEYTDLGAYPAGPLMYRDLLKQMSRHFWGFVGPGKPHRQWHAALPNKLFEYLASGIPVIVWEADESARLVEEYGFGVVIKDLEEIPEIYNEHAACRRIAESVRHELIMENEIYKVLGLYEHVLNMLYERRQRYNKVAEQLAKGAL